MIKSISRIILLVLSEIFVIFFMSFFVLPPTSPLIGDKIDQAYFEALEIIITCNHIKTNYPSAYNEALNEQKKRTITFFRIRDIKFQKYCGLGFRQGSVIIITDTGLIGDCGPLESLVAHEMMHVFGMPLHKLDSRGNQIIKDDPIYKAENICYTNWLFNRFIKEIQ